LNSETINVIIGLCCLFLAIAFFLFKPQLFIFLNYLAKIEFRSMKKQPIKIKSIVPQISKPWPWYKVWAKTLFHPTVTTGESLLAEGNISLRKAILWLVLAGFTEASIRWSLLLFKNQIVINWQNILKLIGDLLLSSLSIPFVVFIFCWVIHLVAKLFRSKGTLKNFFIVYSAFVAPLWIFIGLSSFLAFSVFKIDSFALVAAFLEFYLLLVLSTVAIKSVYRFRWIGACSITMLILVAGFVVIMVDVYNTFNNKFPH